VSESIHFLLFFTKIHSCIQLFIQSIICFDQIIIPEVETLDSSRCVVLELSASVECVSAGKEERGEFHLKEIHGFVGRGSGGVEFRGVSIIEPVDIKVTLKGKKKQLSENRMMKRKVKVEMGDIFCRISYQNLKMIQNISSKFSNKNKNEKEREGKEKRKEGVFQQVIQEDPPKRKENADQKRDEAGIFQKSEEKEKGEEEGEEKENDEDEDEFQDAEGEDEDFEIERKGKEGEEGEGSEEKRAKDEEDEEEKGNNVTKTITESK